MKTSIDNEAIESFLTLLVKTLQKDYQTPRSAREAMEKLLNEADELSLKVSGKRIVERGDRTLLETICQSNPLKRIPHGKDTR